jgi:hypothetical protein
MARKTYYLEQHGIRVDHCRTKTEARKLWESKRDEFVERAASCPQWVFAFHGHVAIVNVEPYKDSWSYTIVSPNHSGRRHGSCFYSAPSQVAAIAVALGSMAQAIWTRDVPDDGALFDEILSAARITAAETKLERFYFVTVTAFWRQNPIAA